jgi:hypothetical protein
VLFTDVGAGVRPETGGSDVEEETMRPTFVAGAGVLALAAAAVLVVVAARDKPAPQPRTAIATEHPATVPTLERTVGLSRTMPAPSVGARRLSALLEHGPMPDRPVRADVVTDSECTPDGRMISRCRNVVRLEDGSELVLRHPHDMRDVPCLAPGERILLVPDV